MSEPDFSDPVQHGGALLAAIAHHGGSVADWLDLSTGISPFSFPLPPLGEEVWRRLPDPASSLALAATAQAFYGGGSVPVITPGSQAAIQHLPALARKASSGAGNVGILSPTYGEYAAAFGRAGFEVRAGNSLERLADCDAVVLANPNNPDGRRIGREELAAFIHARGTRLSVVDEAFADMEAGASVAELTGGDSGLLVLRSFGKFFGMAGLRLGFAFARSDLSDMLSASLGPWAVSGPALAIAAHAFKNPGLIKQQRARITHAHDLTRTALVEAGCRICGETALFFLIETTHGAALAEHLAGRLILVRAFDHSPHVVRIGLAGNEEDAERLRRALIAIASEDAGR